MRPFRRFVIAVVAFLIPAFRDSSLLGEFDLAVASVADRGALGAQ
jgi:hypothetical protein